ncbi:heat shock protein transcriptional repressor HspR [Cellulomonas wangsupingiae]|uniref:Helix-turn-helix transcriptional regulator n=1 Tax=Cellulomonas wangsupingiae TaxID=2968085 RepID=A0ABY5K551_9CELL|nr:helix-turn-helix transcriptional regulator [Cellulomonas wangsupingiae]MCC2335087.1 helix-turn-helix transcriptional regulator [Cellulomonas wangsupingiae]MCM0638959.1 helix-turn-helix transcriptional regulator [Cellulomonas wangsupingiae]UUI65582.1 helix-turn-helix transcriptional regulator [Cellulomonas wangsupingiae]
MDEDSKVYVISVAAELAGMHPQTLRQYDRLGLVRPARTRGRGRRYSMRDIRMLREVQRLSHDEGVNLAGIKRILELEEEVQAMRRQVEFLRTLVDPGRRVFRADPTGNVVADRLHPLAEATAPRPTRWVPRQLTSGPPRRGRETGAVG